METDRLLVQMRRAGFCKGAQLAAALGYYYVLCLSDRTILAQAFGYEGLMYRSSPGLAQIDVIGLIFLCVMVTPVRMRQASDGVLYVLLPLVVIPVLLVATTDVAFASVSASLIASVAGGYVLLAICSMIPRRRADDTTRQLARRFRRQPWAIAILLSAASYALMFDTFGVHLRLLSFSDVYGVRALFTEQAGGLTGYLLEWQANVINPLLIVYGMRSRHTTCIMVGVVGDILIYSTTGFKSVLFSVLAIAALLIAMRKKDSAVGSPAAGVRLGFAFTALVAVSYVIDTLSHGITWTSLFVRRMSLVAGVNTGYYFQYFSGEPKAHLAYGVVGKVLGTTGAMPPAQQIAFYVYHTSGDPNANLWADAYANFGHLGIILFTLILGAFLWCYDYLASNVDQRAAAVMIVAPALSLANSALFTCLLTHGMLLALLVIIQWPYIAGEVEDRRNSLVRPGRLSHLGLTAE